MRFRKHLELERGQKEINITPLVDMVFLLLIFFMLTSSFIVLPAIKINLPKAVTSETVKDKNIIITVNSEDIIYLDEKPISIEELTEFIKQSAAQEEQRPILIKADKESSLGAIVKVWDIAREAQIEQINIATLQKVN